MEITPKTKIDTLLKTYPELEQYLMDLNPKYKKLKNPVLRRTVAKIATLTQVAKIGGYEVMDLVNKLRTQVGQAPLNETVPTEEEEHKDAPEWITQPPVKELNATELLDNDKNPLAELTIALKSMDPGDVLVLESEFLPAPLIDTVEKQGHEVYTKEADQTHYYTFTRKKGK